MTEERKAEVNRRLAEFEDQRDILEGKNFGVALGLPDYTADLNALARLEGRLPPHKWILLGAGATYATLDVEGNGVHVFRSANAEPTEPEARAEAICRYLESRDARDACKQT